jgi:ATP-dependent DNA helicase RecG
MDQATAAAEWLARPVERMFPSKQAAKLRAQLRVDTVEDLLRYFPRRYLSPSHLTPLGRLSVGERITVVARIRQREVVPYRNRDGHVIKLVIEDDSGGTVDVAFFQRGRRLPPWVEPRYAPGVRAAFTGTVSEYRGRLQLAHPRFHAFKGEHTEEQEKALLLDAQLPIAIYPATAAQDTWDTQAAIRFLLDQMPEPLPDPVPDEVLAERGWPALGAALVAMHRPTSDAAWQEARRRFQFEEALVLQTALARSRRAAAASPATPRPVGAAREVLGRLEAGLPFALTGAQRRVGDEIAADLARSHPMRRLLQGDVGSGKTLVALRAALQVTAAGGQAAILAPTEILAQQHLATITRLLEPLGPAAPEVALLTGSLAAAPRREALAAIASGSAGLVIGTHALLSDPVEFADLGLVVVDEQHRFGVEQRDVLRTKAETPAHLLVMTATPIPRTLAMTVFGDMAVSTLDELPAGRPEVTTYRVPSDRPAWLTRTWQRVREEVDAGHRAFVICPRISAQAGEEEAPHPAPGAEPPGAGGPSHLATVEDVARDLAARPELAGVAIGTLHGRMGAEAKERAMAAFAEGSVPVLVATVVVEVGIDVPEATALVVCDADRFGLAQLHQLRGRIGRGTAPGVCLLVSGAEAGSPAAERIEAMEAARDGFVLAEKDLEIRREGDVLGGAQTGTAGSLAFLRVLRDRAVIEQAATAAEAVLAADPLLEHHQGLERRIARALADRAEYLERM